MKKININKEDLEMMNYNDIAHVILENKKKKLKTIDLFKEVCKLLDLDESKYDDHITDFFSLLSTDKRFIMLDGGYWDLKIKHNKGIEIDEESLDDEDEDEEDFIEEMPLDDYSDDDDDEEENDLSDLVIIDEDEEEL